MFVQDVRAQVIHCVICFNLWLRRRCLLQMIVQVLRSLHGDVYRLLGELGDTLLHFCGVLADSLSGILGLRYKGLDTLLELGTQLINLFRGLGINLYVVDHIRQLGLHIRPEIFQLRALGLDLETIRHAYSQTYLKF